MRANRQRPAADLPDPRPDLERRLKAQAGWTDILGVDTDELRSIAAAIDGIRWGMDIGVSVGEANAEGVAGNAS